MKYLTLFSTLLAVATAAPLAEVAEVQSIQDVQDIQVIQDGQAKDPSDAGAQGVKILKKFAEEPAKAGLTRVTKKIGTWSVSSSKMLSTFKMITETPCSLGGCYVTAMEATIRYPDGKEANVDTGAWLHHIAMFGSGTGGGSIWACGNERPTLRLNAASKYGIDWPARYMMMIDLMTEVTTPKSLTLEVTYEIAPKAGSGYKGANMYWLSLGADRTAKPGKYSFETQSMRVTGAGQLLYSIAHMHDGGTDMQLFVESSALGRSGKMVCKSIMHYGEPAAEGEAMAGMDMGTAEKKAAGTAAAAGGHAHGGHSRRDGHGGHDGGHGGHGSPADHIQAPGACTDFGSVAAGNYLRATANYDATKHKLMEHNGELEKLMGNMRVYVGPL